MESPEVKKQFYTKLMDIYRYNPIYIPFLNNLIRYAQKRKYHSDIFKVQRITEGKEDEISNWYNNHRFFFGFGLFRSGTTFLADFLNKSIDNAIVGHEVNVNDYWDYPKALQSVEKAKNYISNYRLNEIYIRNKPYDFEIYGEINPFLRRHCTAIKTLYPDAKLFQVVRNPKKVIRSLMSRELFGLKDPMGKLIVPAVTDEYSNEWKSWGRFEKLCWLWAKDNKLLRETCGHTIQFENLRSDYDYFKVQVLDYLDIEMSSKLWNENIKSVNNPTPKYTFPNYQDWSTTQKEIFVKICGEEMKQYGY